MYTGKLPQSTFMDVETGSAADNTNYADAQWWLITIVVIVYSYALGFIKQS